MRKEFPTIYKVHFGGSAYQEFETKAQAVDKAIEYSIGKEVGKVYIPIYRVERVYTYEEKMGIQTLVKKEAIETLVVLISARHSVDTKGGYIDYEVAQ